MVRERGSECGTSWKSCTCSIRWLSTSNNERVFFSLTYRVLPATHRAHIGYGLRLGQDELGSAM